MYWATGVIAGLLYVSLVSISLQQISLSVSKKLAGISSTSDFARQMLVHDKKGTSHPGGNLIFTQQGAINDEGLEVVEAMLAEAAGCEPHKQPVIVPPHANSSVIWWPSCVLVERCGGCCGNDLLACRPTVTETVTVEVMKAVLPYPGAEQFVFEGIVGVSMEKDVSCECQCREQAHHCTSGQDYLPDQCRCRCRNDAESAACVMSAGKRWNDRTCACECALTAADCSVSDTLNERTCRCEPRTSTTIVDLCASTRCRAGFSATLVSGVCTCTKSPG